MLLQCYSYSGECPCVFCEKNCCINSTDENGLTDTEKLCSRAKEYCESSYNKYQNGEDEE